MLLYHTLVPPELNKIQNTHFTVTAGHRFHFICEVVRSSDRLSRNWIHDGRDLDGCDNGICANGDYLNFTRVEANHNGTYVCNVTNQWGSDTLNFTLNVLGKSVDKHCMLQNLFATLCVHVCTLL